VIHCHHRQGEDVSGWVFLGLSSIGFGMYRLDDESISEPRYEMPRIEGRTEQDEDYAKWCEATKAIRVPLLGQCEASRWWADQLGLPDSGALVSLGTEWLPHDHKNAGDVLCFPERDGKGEIIGYARRYRETGRLKGAKKGIGKRGILIPRGLTPTSYIHDASPMVGDEPYPGPIYLVEGASDVLTLLTMGRNVLGRPSATGGGKYLVDFLRRLPKDWLNLVVVADNARTDDGRWPGKAGASRLAKHLADELQVRVRIIFPGDKKDARDWFKAERIKGRHKGSSDTTRYARAGWDQLLESAYVQKPGQELWYNDRPFVRSATLAALAALTTPLRKTPDLDDLRGERVGEAVADLYAEEEKAYAQKHCRFAMQDQVRFPCGCPRHLGFCDCGSGNPWNAPFRCERRDDVGCRQWHDEREILNIRLRLFEAERLGKQLMRFELPEQKCWKALWGAIQRQGASFYLIRLTDGRVIVFTTFVPTPRSSWFVKGCPVSATEAVAELKQLLPLCDSPSRPCSTSHDWKLVDEEERTFRSVFICCVDPQAIANMEAIAQAVGAFIACRPSKNPSGKRQHGWEYRSLAGWNDDLREHLYACWRCGEALPYRPPEERERDECEREREWDGWTAFDDEMAAASCAWN